MIRNFYAGDDCHCGVWIVNIFCNGDLVAYVFQFVASVVATFPQTVIFFCSVNLCLERGAQLD